MYIYVYVHRNTNVRVFKSYNLLYIKLALKNGMVLVVITCILLAPPNPLLQRSPELFLGSSTEFLI